MTSKNIALKAHDQHIRTEKIHTMREAAALFGVSIATWKRYVAAGIVPKPVQIGPRRIGWLDSELAAKQDEWRLMRR